MVLSSENEASRSDLIGLVSSLMIIEDYNKEKNEQY